MKKLLALALVIVAALLITIPAMAASGVVNSSYGNVPYGTVNYYSKYTSNATPDSTYKVGEFPHGTHLTVAVVNEHWYSFQNSSDQTRYILRQFVWVSGREWELRYGTMELNLGCQWKRYVRQLQLDLNKLGYDAGTVDGAFGEKTRTALTRFQSANGLKSDGRCGTKTKEKLYSVITNID